MSQIPPTEPKPLVDTVLSFVTADTWAASHAYLEQHPELLTDAADQVFDTLLTRAADNPSITHRC